MTAISKNSYFNVLNDFVDKYNKTIKMKPIDVKSDSFADYNKESNEKDSKFKVNDHVKISKYRNIFAKRYTLNWSTEIFVVKKIKKYCTLDLYNQCFKWRINYWQFYEKELQKTNQKEFRIEKVIKRKGNKLYVT